VDCLRRIGVRSKKDAAILSLVLVYCCAVTAILIASLQGLLNPPPEALFKLPEPRSSPEGTSR